MNNDKELEYMDWSAERYDFMDAYKELFHDKYNNDMATRIDEGGERISFEAWSDELDAFEIDSIIAEAANTL